MVMNATWHAGHPMPARATPKQRLRWHLAHARACGCRKPTAAMLLKLRRLVGKPAAATSPRRRRA